MALNEAQKIERSEYLEDNLVITECSQKKNYVFVSYASDNWETVFKKVVVPLQEDYGLHVYADKAFDKVNEKWIVPMLRNVRGSDAVVLFISQKYIESYACFLELLTAANAKKPIVFVSLEEDLHLGDTTDLPEVEPGVKKEILNQGANISTITNNTSNDLMRAMKSAYTSISTLLEQDALSKYDISDAFINFFRDAQANKKTINDIIAIKDTISSISTDVYNKEDIEAKKKELAAEKAAKSVSPAEPVAPAASVAPPVNVVPTTIPQQQAPYVAPQSAPEEKKKKTFPIIIGAAIAALALFAGLIILLMIGLGVGIFAGSRHSADNTEETVVEEVAAPVNEEINNVGTSTDWDLEKMDNILSEQEDENTYILAEDGWHRVNYTDGTIYFGDVKEGFRNGFGVQRDASGKVYGGEWSDDCSDGYGAYMIDDSVYIGQYNHNYPEGWGATIYDTGKVEFGTEKIEGDGSFLTGYYIGFGTNDDSFYGGQIKHNVEEGWGASKTDNGNLYYGQFESNDSNGLGIYILADGTVTCGEWRNNLYVKSSETLKTFEIESGDIYYGEMSNDLPNGHGVMVQADGTIKAGEWVNGNLDGFATEFYTNGVILSGFFKAGNPDGEGVHIWADKSFMAGVYEQAEGGSELADGYVIIGYIQDGKYSSIYAGDYVNKSATGKGIQVYSDRTFYGGDFVGGVYSGVGTLVTEDVIKAGYFENNEFVREIEE